MMLPTPKMLPSHAKMAVRYHPNHSQSTTLGWRMSYQQNVGLHTPYERH